MGVQVDVSPLKRLMEGIAGDPSPEVIFWQLGVAAVAVVLGFFAARIACREIKPSAQWKFGEGDFERVAYPLFTYIFLFAGRMILQQHQRVPLLDIIQTLLVAWIVIRIAVYVLGHVLPPGGFLRGSIKTIAWIAWIGVALHVVGLLDDTFEALDAVGFSLGKDRPRITLLLVMQALAALALTLTLAAWISRITESRVMSTEHLEMSTRVVISKVVHAAAIFIAILVALPMVGIDITALSIFSGALGVGLGFGLQKIASNYVSGFIVLLDRSLRIGDIITVDNRKGEVKAIESRYTVIKGGDGVESIIPNEKLITESVNHHTFTDAKVSSNMLFVVPFEADVDQVSRLLVQAAAAQQGVLPEPAPASRIRQLREYGIELELIVWLEANSGIPEADVRGNIFKASLGALRTAGVDIPYPRRDVRHVATPATNQTPAGSIT